MKYSVTVENFYLDENSDLKKGLKSFILNNLIQTVWKKIETKVEDAVTKAIKDRVENILDKRIETEVARLFTVAKVATKDYNGKVTGEQTLEQYVKQRFLENSGWSSPATVINDIAKEFGWELKARYDVAFATQVVVRLNEQGMLKENVDKLLLSKPE